MIDSCNFDNRFARALAEMMTYFEWSEFAMLYNDDLRRRKCASIKQGIDEALLKNRIGTSISSCC